MNLLHRLALASIHFVRYFVATTMHLFPLAVVFSGPTRSIHRDDTPSVEDVVHWNGTQGQRFVERVCLLAMIARSDVSTDAGRYRMPPASTNSSPSRSLQSDK